MRFTDLGKGLDKVFLISSVFVGDQVCPIGQRSMCFLQDFRGGKKIIVFCHVDDTIIIADNKTRNDFLKKVAKHFDYPDAGFISEFCGIQIERTAETLTLKQTRYLEDILDTYNMTSFRAITVPIQSHMVKAKEGELNDPSNYNHDFPYRNAVVP